PRILGNVGRPQRLPRLPRTPGESLSRTIDQRARGLDEALDRRLGDAPGSTVAQHVPGFLHREVAAAIPGLRLAHGTYARLQAPVHVVRFCKIAVYRALQRPQVFFALARRDVFADAAVAAERAGRVEDRMSAHAGPGLRSRFVDTTQLQVVERLVSL